MRGKTASAPATHLPTENKAWENSPCLLGAADGHAFPENVRWRWAAAGERWSDPVPERHGKKKQRQATGSQCREERETRCLFKAYHHFGSPAKLAIYW